MPKRFSHRRKRKNNHQNVLHPRALSPRAHQVPSSLSVSVSGTCPRAHLGDGVIVGMVLLPLAGDGERKLDGAQHPALQAKEHHPARARQRDPRGHHVLTAHLSDHLQREETGG